MEPIRPDEDELRATRDPNTEQRQGKKPEKAARPPGKGGKGGNGGGGGKRSPGPLYLLVLLIVAGTGAAGWHQQNQRIEQMESQLEEADYWARQSKLALARFEGELSETGEDLQETGQSIEQQLSNQAGRLDEADSEIRKLWGVANDRNKSRLNDHEDRLAALDKSVQEAASKRQTLAASVTELEKNLAGEFAAQAKRIESQQSALDKLTASVDSVDEQVESQLKRFQREQSLTIDGLEGRISSLEKTTQALSGGEIQALRSELSSLNQTVSSIDASRAQLTSRLVRLSEEVSQLRSQAGGQ